MEEKLWLVYSGINGKGANAQNAEKHATNSMIGICAQENVSAVEKRSRNSTNGRGADVLGAEKQEMRNMIGTTAGVRSAVRKVIIG